MISYICNVNDKQWCVTKERKAKADTDNKVEKES